MVQTATSPHLDKMHIEHAPYRVKRPKVLGEKQSCPVSKKQSSFCDTRLNPAQDISADRVFETEVSSHTKRCKRLGLRVNATDLLGMRIGVTACLNSFRACVCVCVCVYICIYIYIYICIYIYTG